MNQTQDKKISLWEDYLRQEFIRSAPDSSFKSDRLQALRAALFK
jgi:hypothetical protein